MASRDKGRRPSIRNSFNRRAKRPSRLRRFIACAAVIVGINTAMNIDGYETQWLKDKFTDAGARDSLTIDERVALGRYVPPGANARHLQKFPGFGYDERTGVPPADGRIPGLLEELIDGIPANDNIHIETLQDLSLDKAEAYANRLIGDERFMDSFKEMESLRQLELGAAVIFALRNGGMSETERKFQAWFVENYEAPQNYQAWLDRQVADLSSQLAHDDKLQDNLSRWVPRYTYQDVPEAEEQFRLRHDAMQYIADKVLEKFGYDPVPVFLSVNGTDIDPRVNAERMKTTLGQFNFIPQFTGGEFILVNYFDPSVEMAIGSTLSDTQSALNTILEEARHATDVFTVHDVFQGRIDRDDPRYAHGLALFINLSGEYGRVKYVDIPVLGRIPWSVSSYTDQYIERTAKDFAKAMNDAMEDAPRPDKPTRPAPKRASVPSA